MNQSLTFASFYSIIYVLRHPALLWSCNLKVWECLSSMITLMNSFIYRLIKLSSNIPLHRNNQLLKPNQDICRHFHMSTQSTNRQIDNQLYDTPFDVMMYPVSPKKDSDFLHLSLVASKIFQSVDYYTYFGALMQVTEFSMNFLNERNAIYSQIPGR